MKKAFLLSVPLAVLLFYAGASKGFDAAAFQVQLGKSPLLPAPLVPLLAYGLPWAEILIAIALFTDRFFRPAAYASLALMALFTLYLGALLTLFPKEEIPCSCGGILGQMSYGVHFWFNLGFTILAAMVCYLADQATADPAQSAAEA